MPQPLWSQPLTETAAHAARYETVTEAGPEAPWITLVHGVSQDRRVFLAQVAAFRTEFRLLLVDLPGHGLSTELPGPFGLEEFAASLEGALVEVGIGPSHFWGTHLGAAAGLLLACRAPERFTSLILEAPVFPGRALPSVSKTLARVAETAKAQGLEAAKRLWWEEGDWFAVMRARPEDCRAAEQCAIIADFQGRPWLDSGLARPIAPVEGALAQLETPALILSGEHDLTDFLEAAGALAALLPNAQRAIIEEAGGFPLWEFPDRVNTEVERFLNAL